VLLPAETVVLASLPDLPRTASRWPKTILAKIGAEPEMKAFLERPLQYSQKTEGVGSTNPRGTHLRRCHHLRRRCVDRRFSVWAGKRTIRQRRADSRGGPAPMLCARTTTASRSHRACTTVYALQRQQGHEFPI
jgi:hypothetical protein